MHGFSLVMQLTSNVFPSLALSSYTARVRNVRCLVASADPPVGVHLPLCDSVVAAILNVQTSSPDCSPTTCLRSHTDCPHRNIVMGKSVQLTQYTVANPASPSCWFRLTCRCHPSLLGWNLFRSACCRDWLVPPPSYRSPHLSSSAVCAVVDRAHTARSGIMAVCSLLVVVAGLSTVVGLQHSTPTTWDPP